MCWWTWCLTQSSLIYHHMWVSWNGLQCLNYWASSKRDWQRRASLPAMSLDLIKGHPKTNILAICISCRIHSTTQAGMTTRILRLRYSQHQLTKFRHARCRYWLKRGCTKESKHSCMLQFTYLSPILIILSISIYVLLLIIIKNDWLVDLSFILYGYEEI